MATDGGLGVRVAVPRLGGMLAESRSPPLEGRAPVMESSVVAQGGGLEGEAGSCSTKCQYDDCCLFHGK